MEEEITIRIKNLTKSFNGNKVLDGLDIDIKKGETLGILGKSGSGKSVFLKHLIGLMKPDSGQIYIGAIDIAPLAEEEISVIRRMLFGMLFQSGALLDSLTVAENVALPLREGTNLAEDKIDKKVKEKLELVGLKDIEEQMPDSLSGGMRRRVGLARALVMEPEIILYDEPTSGLDPIIANSINQMILEVKKLTGATSIVVTHDLNCINIIADRVGLLYDGKILAIDEKEKFMKSENPYVQQFIHGRIEGPIKIR
ncbi:MAG: ABC transporter ATP-binding protein [Candidatus Omnitrophica bacterium]|nr:ABC transporter ATP-binding protein [Candidatus Omnitrophota bacterium]MBU1047125.1 ABC transporter ATP-binding protein [Candidatus Omnitrophota bacterium]MBU1630797.1 ABC transporter ATP-binding protein [Candidatus Omnitrophota bacterium]MBU1889597.1 ABC transporter ATP-binding protein [Candidatus Omnitrophota bacterium]